MILAWTGDELSRGQTSSSEWGKIDYKVKIDLEDLGQWLPKVFFNFGPNLVILAWTSPALLHKWLTHKQVMDKHNHTRTYTQVTAISEGQTWPRIKNNNVRYHLSNWNRSSRQQLRRVFKEWSELWYAWSHRTYNTTTSNQPMGTQIKFNEFISHPLQNFLHWQLCPLLLTCFNFSPNMGKQLHPL